MFVGRHGRFFGRRRVSSHRLLRMENRQCEREFRRVELVAQLRARQLEHAVEIVRWLAVDVH